MKKLVSNGIEFELVEKIPEGYVIWNIGTNMKDGYLPLCQIDNGYNVNVETLKAIKLEKAQEILAIIGCVKNKNSKGLKTYYKRYIKSKDAYTRKKALMALNAANLLIEVE